ncbi:MAG: CPBP family intramembrane metalloprotease [Bacteroidales bacterium]|nr:CPBP family intramembrane metalloprotease [Bacteroidales bacterium]
MSNSKTKRNLFLFIIIVIVSGWLGVIIDKYLPQQESENTLGMGLWLISPLIIVIILRTFLGDGWKDAGLKLILKNNAVWYLASLIIFPLVTGIVLIIGKCLNWIDLSGFNTYAFANAFVGLLVIAIVKNIFEEFVWRGYLTSKLIKLNTNDIAVYLIVGLVWSIWHLPYYLVFLSDSSMVAVLPVSRILFFIVASLNMMIWTIMFVEIYRLTNSVWPAVLMHSVEDSFINPLVIDGYIRIAGNKEIFISPICGIITAALYLAIGLWLRKRRKSAFIQRNRIPE